jgi:hypothetical protein
VPAGPEPQAVGCAVGIQVARHDDVSRRLGDQLFEAAGRGHGLDAAFALAVELVARPEHVGRLVDRVGQDRLL